MVLWCIFIASIVQLSYCANVYYKLSPQSQDVFGPFAEQQVIGWLEQGYFDVTQLVISREHEDAFIPMGRYFSRESNDDHSSTVVSDDPSNAISYNPSDDQRYDGGEDRHVYYDDSNHQPSTEDYAYNPVGTIGRSSASGILSSLSRRASSLITSNTKGLIDITKIIRKKISHSASSVVGISSGSGMRGPYPLRRREDPNLIHRVDEEVDFDGRNENVRVVIHPESDSSPQHQHASKQFDNDYSVDDSGVDHVDDGAGLHNPIDKSINQASANEELLTNRTQILLSEIASKHEVINPHTSFIDKGPVVWSMSEASVSSSSSASSSLPKQSTISPNDPPPPPPLILPTEHPSITHHDRFSVKSIGSHEYSTDWSDMDERSRKGGILRSFLKGRSLLSISTISSGLDRDGHRVRSSSSSGNNMHRWSVEAVIQLVKRWLERIIITLPQYVLSWFVKALIPSHVRRASSILYSIALPGGDATTAAAEGIDRRSNNWLLLTHMVICGALRYVSTLLSIIALPMVALLVRDAMRAMIIPSSTVTIGPIGAALHGLQTSRVVQHLHKGSLLHFIRYELSSITYYRTFFQQCFNSFQSIDLNEALSNALITWRYIQAQCISMLMGALDNLHSSISTIVSTPLLTQAGALIVGVMVIECIFIPYLTSEISSAHVSTAAISKQWNSDDDYKDTPLVAVNDDDPSKQLGIAGTMMVAPIVTYISSVYSSVGRLVAVMSSLLVVTSSLHISNGYSMGCTNLIILLLTPYISIALLGTIHLYFLPIPTHRSSTSSSSSSSSSSTSHLPIPTTTLSTQEQLYADCSKRVDYLTHLLMSDSCLHHECDRWGLVAYISAWLDREHGHLQSLSRRMASEQRDATIDRVIRSSDDDADDDGHRRESRAVLLKVLMNSLFTAVVVGTALHSALRIMSQQMDDSNTGSHQLFNQLRTAFNAVIQQPHSSSSDIRPQDWIQGVYTAIAKVIVIDPSNLLLRSIYGTIVVSDSQHAHISTLHTLGSLYSDCLQWMQWDVGSTLAVVWMLSPIVIWLHHIQSMTLVDISGSEIISIIQAVMRQTPSIPLPYTSKPMSHHKDFSASQRKEQPRLHSSADDHDDTLTGSIMASPDAAAGIVFKGIGAFIDGRSALKDVQLRFAPGTITVLLNPSSGSTVSTNCLLRLIYHDEGRRGSSSSRSIRVDSGSVMVHGGNLKDWHVSALRQKITFLKEEELRFQLQAGAVAGCLPGTAGDSLRAAIQVQEMTGADEVIASLPRGPASVLEGELSTILSDVQWRRLHISRALCHLDKDIVLLCLPTMVLSEEQEARLLKYLRDAMSKSPHKIIIITTHRISSLIGIDQIVLFSDEGGIIDHLSISELSGQPESRRSPDNSLIMRRLALTRRMLSHQK